MKFGQNLYQRSVPRWSAYNVKYNELKHLIKQRTSAGSALPISIPSASTSRWHDLETELYPIIKREYDDVALFLRTKQGEIERRLAYLDKQVNTACRAVASADIDQPVTQARKYQRLVKDAEALGNEIESLSRFAAVQKTAFRKILKKYRKWTGSTELQTRLDMEVFASGALQVDYASYLQRLAKLSNIISTKLQVPMLTGGEAVRAKRNTGRTLSQSNAKAMNDMCLQGPLYFDHALDQVPYGENGGSAYFWVHPEYLEQIDALLLRHMRQPARPARSRGSPNQSTTDVATTDTLFGDTTYQAIFDNTQRFIRDEPRSKPCKAALTGSWNAGTEAVVSFSGLTHKSEQCTTISMKRKYLASILNKSSGQDDSSASRGGDFDKVRGYLSENRDVKPLAIIQSDRARFSGPNNTKDVGTWATLDTSVTFSSATEDVLGQVGALPSGKSFPHAVLHVRWEFSRLPELVRVLETSHLTERVHGFSLEQAAIYSLDRSLPQPQWRDLLANDIRKVPGLLQKGRVGTARRKDSQPIVVSTSSAPSSTGDSVFSVGQGQSSTTDIEVSPSKLPEAEPDLVAPLNGKERKQKRKRTRFVTPAPQQGPQRYWNEFDDGDSDTHIEERYAIYIDPNEPAFPGAETVSKVFSGMYDSLSKGGSKLVSWLPLGSTDTADNDGERSPLLFGDPRRKGSGDAHFESSGSETDDMSTKTPKHHRRNTMTRPPWAPDRRLSRRQQTREATLQRSYIGLLAIAYLLLTMSAILLGSGRKKKQLEVDAGVVTGVVAAWASAGISVVLICMRRQKLGPIHWGLFAVNVAIIVTLGTGEMALMVGNSL